MALIICASCSSKLKVPDDSAGRKFKCPNCGGVIIVPQKKAAAPADSTHSEQAEPQPPVVEAPMGSMRLKRKRKKKKTAERPSESRIPEWAWWWGSLVVLAALTAAALYGISESGYPKTALVCVSGLVFACPINTVIFALSLLICNSFGDGVELSDFDTLIPKSLILVLLASIVGLMPCVGPFVAIGIWFIGSMIFFKMEAWETKLLVGINFVLGLAMWFLLIVPVTSRMAPKPNPEDFPIEKIRGKR
jgi:predicted RNA-binding Zn-ribbon protein involved in translation (DUF1610 family)